MLKNKNKIILLVLFFFLTGGAAWIAIASKSTPEKTKVSSPSSANTNPVQKIDTKPATENDQVRVDDNKQRIVDSQDKIAPTSPAAGKKTVKPTITYAGQYSQVVEVGGYVSGVYEDGGSCTATFDRAGSNSFSRTTLGVKNVTSVDCPVISVPVSDFGTKGEWSVTLNYDSATAQGLSERKKIEVK